MANYPVPYNSFGYSGAVGQQMYPQYQQSMLNQTPQIGQTQQTPPGLTWVDGEVGAKAYQLPAGLPANQPVALWDTNDTVIYLKSVNPMGMPNPLQKARYKLEGGKSGEASQAFSGDLDRKDEYVRREDLELMKQELMEAISNLNAGTASAKRTTKEA